MEMLKSGYLIHGYSLVVSDYGFTNISQVSEFIRVSKAHAYPIGLIPITETLHKEIKKKISEHNEYMEKTNVRSV